MIAPTTSSMASAKTIVSPQGHARRGVEANHHGRDITHRVDDTVTVVIQRDRGFAVTIDDEIRILENFPGTFDCDGETEAQGERPFLSNEPEQAIEKEAVDDVGRGVPVAEVLGVFRTHHHAMPKFDIAAFADGFTPHGQKNDGYG